MNTSLNMNKMPLAGVDDEMRQECGKHLLNAKIIKRSTFNKKTIWAPLNEFKTFEVDQYFIAFS